MRSIEERTIKHLKETIELLKKENMKLKLENKKLYNLKDTVIKLQEEKLELSRKLIDMESEAVLYKDKDELNDEMLYNPRRNSKISTMSTKDLLQRLNSNFSEDNNKKVSPQDNFKKENTNFFILGKKQSSLKDNLKNKNEEILLLKNELVKKEQIITELKLKKNLKKNDIKKFDNKNYYNKSESKELNDSIFGDNDGNINLKNNINWEIQNILNEKRDFILKTLTRENFSFDFISSKYKSRKSNESINGQKNDNNLEQILDLIRQRKKRVEMIKKNLEEKIG